MSLMLLLLSSGGSDGLLRGEPVAVFMEESGIADVAAFDAWDLRDAVSEGVCNVGDGEPGLPACGPEIGCGLHGLGVGDEVEDLAGDGALEAAEDVLLAFALGGALGRVGARVGVGGEADQRDAVQGGVRCCVATAVEAVTGGAAR